MAPVGGFLWWVYVGGGGACLGDLDDVLPIVERCCNSTSVRETGRTPHIFDCGRSLASPLGEAALPVEFRQLLALRVLASQQFTQPRAMRRLLLHQMRREGRRAALANCA